MYKEKFFDIFKINEHDLSRLKGALDISHNGIFDGNYAYTDEFISIFIKIPRSILPKSVKLIIFDAHDPKKTETLTADLKYEDLEFSCFSLKYNAPNSPTLLYFYPEIEATKKLYGKRGENGILNFSLSLPKDNFYQITITEKMENEDINGVIYHLFVDRFYKTGNFPTPDGGVLVENWYSEIPEFPEYAGAFLKNNSFYGGNLYGVAEKIPYLKSLGVSIIYLSPIFESRSNHKYDTSNYMKVDEGFGADEGLKHLIRKADEENIGIILDGVFNHTGSDSIYFNKFKKYDSIGAYNSKESPYYDWYTFYEYPDKYESWWGIDILPKINLNISSLENYFLDEKGVIEKWMSFGIKGFRLDVADELSDSFIEKLRRVMLKFNKTPLLYGEVWEDGSNKIAYGTLKRYYLGNELSGVMNYPLKNGIISYIREKRKCELEYALNTVTMNMPKEIRNKAMNILGSHDTERILTALGGKSSKNKTNRELSTLKMSKNEYMIAKKRLISAYTILICLPGIPTIYYGDEVGMEGYSDPFNRKGFPWGKEDREILSHYRKCGKIRNNVAALRNGDLYILSLSDDLFIFERKEGPERIICAYNNFSHAIKLSFKSHLTELISEKENSEFYICSEEAMIFKTRDKTEIEIENIVN